MALADEEARAEAYLDLQRRRAAERRRLARDFAGDPDLRRQLEDEWKALRKT